MYETLIKYEAALYFLIATFGLPKLNLEELQADPTSLLALIPLIALMYDWKKFEGALMAPYEKTEVPELANGAPPQVAEENKVEEPAQADEPEPEKEPEEKEAPAAPVEDDPEVSF